MLKLRLKVIHWYSAGIVNFLLHSSEHALYSLRSPHTHTPRLHPLANSEQPSAAFKITSYTHFKLCHLFPKGLWASEGILFSLSSVLITLMTLMFSEHFKNKSSLKNELQDNFQPSCIKYLSHTMLLFVSVKRIADLMGSFAH